MRGRRLGAGIALLASSFLVGLAPHAEADVEGLTETNAARYVVAADGSAVKVSVTMSLRNTLPDQRSGNQVRYFYFTSYQVPVPAGASNLRATSGGSTLTVTTEDGPEASIRIASIAFPQLRYARTREITLTYDLPGAELRSKDPTRVGKGFAAFPALAWGEPGRTTLDIVAPEGYDFHSTSDIFTETAADSSVTRRASEHTDETGIWAFVTLRDPAQTAERSITVGGDEVSLLSFPGDEAWADFVDQKLAEGVPALEELLGTPWPGGLDTVREDVSPTVTGYAWFDFTQREILLGEEFDTQLLLHETSHAWLNDDHLSGRWLQEGLAEVVSRRLAPRIGGEETPSDVPERDSGPAFPLSQWRTPTGLAVGETDEYGYAAAHAAVDELIGGLEDEDFTTVVQAALAGESAYEPPGSEDNRGTTDARRFLDLVESRGGNTDADQTYATWVLDDDAATTLEQRSVARDDYAAVDAADEGWLPPRGLRIAMSRWDFGGAGDLMGTLGEQAQVAGELQQAAAAAGLELAGEVREGYENAEDESGYSSSAELLAETGESLERVEGARGTVEGAADPLSDLGMRLLRTEAAVAGAREAFSDGDLATAVERAALATEQTRWAPWLSTSLILVTALTVGGLIVGLVALVRRPRRGRPAAPSGPPLAGGGRPPTATGDGTY